MKKNFNLKNYFTKTFQVGILFATCFTFVGCDMPTFSPEGGGQIPDGEGFNISSVKVLRKPLNGYDFDDNVSTDTSKGGNDYYRYLSEDILTKLFDAYGNFNSDIHGVYNNVFEQINSVKANDKVSELETSFSTNPEQFKYFYDTIRYQIISEDVDATSSNILIKFDKSKAWNWSVPFETGADLNNKYNPYLAEIPNTEQPPAESKPNIVAKKFDISNYTFDMFKEYYSGDSFQLSFNTTNYSSAFINDDYVNALTYAIYNIVLGTNMKPMSVSYATGTPVITIEGFTADSQKTSTQKAVEEIKATFKQLGAYVGLTERNKENIVNFVLTEVIGTNAQAGVNRLYDPCYKDVVSAVVDYAGSLTKIGITQVPEGGEPDEEGDTTVGESYMASEVVDYPATSFTSFGGASAFEYTKPYEYQSMIIAPKYATNLTDLWLDFKYDAGDDGDAITTDEVLEIEVIVRWRKESGEILQLAKNISVPDGPFDPGEDTHWLAFEFHDRPYLPGPYFNEPIKVNKFNCPDALVPKEGEHVITLTGSTAARRYYKVMEGTNGVYGVIDPNRVEGSYLEIAFNIKKDPDPMVQLNKNYKFYTAISNFYDDVGDGLEWH